MFVFCKMHLLCFTEVLSYFTQFIILQCYQTIKNYIWHLLFSVYFGHLHDIFTFFFCEGLWNNFVVYVEPGGAVHMQGIQDFPC